MSKSELIKASWNNDPQIISNNTFYQMVFNLRKNLEKVGGDAVIVTVPRRGLRINPDVRVKIIDASDHVPPRVSDKTFSSLPVITGVFSLYRGRDVFLVMLSVGVLLLTCFLYMSDADGPAFYDYHHQEYKRCTVAFNDRIAQENVISLVMKSGIDCSQKKHLILTQSENHARLSVITCSAGTLKTNNCTLSLSVQ